MKNFTERSRKIEIGESLKEYRTFGLGLTRKQAAAVWGISVRSVERWENGQISFSSQPFVEVYKDMNNLLRRGDR